jgi:hypothetical protein
MLQNSPGMAAEPVRLLLIQTWVIATDGLRARLAAAGFTAWITRVDFEAALDAACWRRDFDAVIVNPATPGLPVAIVEARMKELGIDVPVVELDDLETLCTRLRHAIAARRN